MRSQTEIAKTRVPLGTRARIDATASEEGITESAWLRRLILREVRMVGAQSGSKAFKAPAGVTVEGKRQRRVNVALRKDDLLLLEARSEARGLRPATYLSVLARSHLRRLPPLPQAELLALKASVSGLGAIGRNLNQIARAINQSGRVSGLNREDLRAILRVCEALRDHTKALLKANAASWEQGHG